MNDTDDMLTRPLGTAVRPARSRLAGVRVPAGPLAGLASGALVIAGAALALFGDPEGGEPRVSAAIAIREAAKPATAPVVAEAAPDGPVRRSAEDVERASGVTVTRAGGAKAPDVAVIIGTPDSDAAPLAAAPDPRIVERGRHGPLPRLGEGRLRALDLYARASDPDFDGPRIAVLISGIGVGDSATAAAITRLPTAVSLAVTPYGQDVDKTAARARLAGHEILVQLPMEPFDYPDSDPGPRTLLTSARAGENLDRALWTLSRLPGAVGAVNFMGGKFTSDAGAFEPVLRELGTRGLGYVEDATMARSLATTLAPKVKTPFVRAEVAIDALARPDAIDVELRKLEALALAKGLVVASASASPMTIDRLARWARDLESRGIHLVPVSAALRARAAKAVSTAEVR